MFQYPQADRDLSNSTLNCGDIVGTEKFQYPQADRDLSNTLAMLACLKVNVKFQYPQGGPQVIHFSKSPFPRSSDRPATHYNTIASNSEVKKKALSPVF